MKKILITGGAGFIGSNLIRDLLPQGQYQITCLDNFDPYYPRWQKEANIKTFLKDKHFRLVEGDICNQRDLARVGPVDTIVHLAAKTGVRHSYQHPFTYDKVNVEGTRNLLEFARKNEVPQFVFSSSSSVYGQKQPMPWKESGMIDPVSPYAISKFSAETLGELYSHLYGIRFLALRFFTVYGPGQRPDQAIHDFVDLTLQGRAINVFGDGSSSRDYTFVSDIVSGLKAAMHYYASPFEVINLGSSTPVSLQAVIDHLEMVCSRKINVHYCNEQAGDVNHTCADIEKAARLLHYRPLIDMETGIRAFYNWFMVHLAHINSFASRKVA